MKKIIFIIFIICAISCGELRENKTIKPMNNTGWSMYDDAPYGKASTLQHSSGPYLITVFASTHSYEKVMVGPAFLPIIPNYTGKYFADKVIIEVVITPIPDARYDLNEAYIYAKNKTVKPLEIKSFRNDEKERYILIFEYKKLTTGLIEFRVPKSKPVHDEIMIKYELKSESDYKLVPPKGIYQ